MSKLKFYPKAGSPGTNIIELPDGTLIETDKTELTKEEREILLMTNNVLLVTKSRVQYLKNKIDQLETFLINMQADIDAIKTAVGA